MCVQSPKTRPVHLKRAGSWIMQVQRVLWRIRQPSRVKVLEQWTQQGHFGEVLKAHGYRVPWLFFFSFAYSARSVVCLVPDYGLVNTSKWANNPLSVSCSVLLQCPRLSVARTLAGQDKHGWVSLPLETLNGNGHHHVDETSSCHACVF